MEAALCTTGFCWILACQSSSKLVQFLVHLLISPEQFDSALKLLNSPLWSMITENDVEEHFIFEIPDYCPVSQAPACKSSGKDEHDLLLGNKENEASGKNALVHMEEQHGLISKKRRGKATLVDTDVSRSDRIRTNNAGFKAPPCPDFSCLPCNASPP